MSASHIERRSVPERVKQDARIAVWVALDEGRLVRPRWCESCKRKCKPHAAHEDYTKPLDVRWLCASCHQDWDIHGIDPSVPKF